MLQVPGINHLIHSQPADSLSPFPFFIYSFFIFHCLSSLYPSPIYAWFIYINTFSYHSTWTSYLSHFYIPKSKSAILFSLFWAHAQLFRNAVARTANKKSRTELKSCLQSETGSQFENERSVVVDFAHHRRNFLLEDDQIPYGFLKLVKHLAPAIQESCC